MGCRYCAFSGQYHFTRTHSGASMSLDVAQQAVDAFVNGAKASSRNPYHPAVTFYGGEPLVRFDLVKQLIEYARARYGPLLSFSLSTNGLLLDEATGDFLAGHWVSLALSLDGPKQVHDRNRVDTFDNGTFDRVFANVRAFRLRHPQAELLILSCFDDDTDVVAAAEFFAASRDVLRAPTRV